MMLNQLPHKRVKTILIQTSPMILHKILRLWTKKILLWDKVVMSNSKKLQRSNHPNLKNQKVVVSNLVMMMKREKVEAYQRAFSQYHMKKSLQGK
jgi:hypothetical protein